MSNPIPERIIPLEPLGENGKPPKSRVANASDAAQITDAVVYANQERSRFNAKLRGMFDGNPPYSPAKLRGEAQAWRTNVSFREGKAASSAAKTPFYDLFAGAKYFSQVFTKHGTPEEMVSWSDVLTEEFSWLLKSYKGFDFNVQQSIVELVRYGKGLLIWRDPYDWRFRWVPQHHVYVLDGSDCYAGNLDVLVIRERWRVNELWGYIKNRKAAEEMGWDADACTDALRNAMPDIEGDASTKYDYEWIQQRIKDRDIFYGVRASTVAIRHLLVKEYSDEVTHYIVEERRQGARQQSMSRDQNPPLQEKFLYACTRKFDDFDQFVATFFLETEDGTWNGAQGLGHDILSVMSLKDRVKCSAVDLMFLRTGVSLQARNASSAQKMSIIRFGAVNIIPPDCDVQQSTILGDIESPVVMDRMLDQVVANNTGVYRQQAQRVQGNPRTAEEVKLEYQTQAVLSNSAVNRYYLQLDRFYAEIYRRVCVCASQPYDTKDQGIKLAKEFIDRCKAKGVPEKAIKDVLWVGAYRNAGNGSPVMRQQAIGQTLPFVPMMPEDGKQNFLNFALSSIHGPTMAQLFNPKRDGNALPNKDEALATIENAAIKIGSPVLITADQNDTTHATVHLNAAGAAAQSLTNGADPHEVADFIEGIGRHVGQHLDRLAQNPQRKADYKRLSMQWKQLSQMHDKLVQQIQVMNEQMAAQQKQTQQAMSDVQLENLKVQSDVRRRDVKTAAGIRQSRAKATQQMALADAETAAKIRRDNALALSQAKNRNGSEE